MEFGIDVAQRGLWREAIYRWERAVADRSDLRRRAQQSGDRLRARRASSTRRASAYEKALELEPNNTFIKQNYELFKEINDRTTRTGQSVASSRRSLADRGVHQLLRDPDRDADPAEAGRLGVPARARRRVHRRRHRGRRRATWKPTRLLRSQLRTKSELRVIDADVLPLMDVADRDRAAPASSARRSPRANGPDGPAARSRKRRTSSRTSTSSPTSSTGSASARSTRTR